MKLQGRILFILLVFTFLLLPQIPYFATHRSTYCQLITEVYYKWPNEKLYIYLQKSLYKQSACNLMKSFVYNYQSCEKMQYMYII